MKLKKRLWLPVITAVAALCVATSSSALIVLTFEGVGDGNSVGGFYNGGAGGNYGITFSDNSLALVDADAGGGGNFGGEPSPDTILFFLGGGAATMSVEGGFTDGFSFYYSAISAPGFVRVYDGLNGTGNILASLELPITPSDGGDPTGSFSPFYDLGVTFSGTAFSVDFGGSANFVGFDNITLGSATPGSGNGSGNPNSVPDTGATLSLMGLALAGLALAKRKIA